METSASCEARSAPSSYPTLFLLRFIGYDDVRGGGLAGNHRMCDLMVRQGPEGRLPNISPARKGWVLNYLPGRTVEDDPERRRCGTLPLCYPNLISP